MNKKEAFYLLAIKDILEIFAEQELGCTYDLNIPVIVQYMNSDTFMVKCIEATTKEEIYQIMTDEILNGYPVWDLLIMPEWTKNMLERSFNIRIEKEEEKRKKKYKCLTCKYLDTTTFAGCDIYKCMHDTMTKSRNKRCYELKRDEEFKLKTRCKNYEKTESKA